MFVRLLCAAIKEDPMTDLNPDTTRAAVRERYGDIARTSGSRCGPTGCGTSSVKLGYSQADLFDDPRRMVGKYVCLVPRTTCCIPP